ncbi:MAG: SAM-dependent methyltransferase, partial [Actinomycetota bacterium]|nr:SAM-dependent methyltransferase [Actinomycetota bacterium]
SSERLAQRADGTLVAYSKTGVDDDVLAGVGEKDITSHVNWTAVTHALSMNGLGAHGPFAQRDVLHALGSRDIDERLRNAHRAAVLEGSGAAALQTLSRRQALGALTDPGGLGGLDVVIATRSCDPSFLSQL